MLSKIKNLKGGTGFVVGLIVAMLIIPSVAVAATGLVTIKGSPSGNKADVTPANQLLTNEANPSQAVR